MFQSKHSNNLGQREYLHLKILIQDFKISDNGSKLMQRTVHMDGGPTLM